MDLSKGNILVYEGGENAVLYDKNWNAIQKLDLDPSKLTIPMGKQQVRVEMEGSKDMVGKMEFKILGEKVLISGKRDL